MKKSITKFVVALGIFLAGLLCIGNTEEASALKVEFRTSPTAFNYELKPGETVSGTFELANLGNQEFDYELKASPYFTESNDNGNVKVRYDIENSYTQIANWVTFDKDKGTIGPESAIDINFTIKVPDDVPSGGQYTALLASTRGKQTEEGENQGVTIGEVMSIGPVVYAKVEGDTRETGEIIKNETGGFLFAPPITASSTVKNTGNVHTKAIYTMKVYPLFGGDPIFSNEDNPVAITILPDTTRYYELSWTSEQSAPSIGIFKVESEVKIFDQVSKIEKIVIICPMWVIILMVVFILALILWVVSRAKARKKAAA